MVTKLRETMSAFWDIAGKAASLFQLVGGMDAVTIITVATSFLRFHEIRKECRKLEERVRMLRVLLLSPAGHCIMQQQQNLELGHLVANAIKDARDLVDSYNGSTLFARVRRGRSMARRFRDLRSGVDCYCSLILSVNAFLLAVQANLPPPTLVRTEVNDGVPPSTGNSIDAETSSTAAPEHTHIVIDISQE